MKRIGNIYNQVCSKENISSAIKSASKGKTDRKTVIKYLEDIEGTTDKIEKMLLAKAYIPTEPHEFERFDGARQKVRIITCPSFFPDQIVHWALMQVVSPYLLKSMYEYSCGSIPGRGSIYAKRSVEHFIRSNKMSMSKYALQMDIHKFYKSINREVLKEKMLRLFKDKDVLWLINTIIDSYHGDGIPIGFFTSQWFANYYLTALDHYIKQELKIKGYFRYMDDMLLFGANKKFLHGARERVSEQLNKIKLELKSNWQVYRVDSRPVDFVGYRIYRNYTTIRRNTFLRMTRRIRKISKKTNPSPTDARALMSYMGIMSHADSHLLKEKYLYPFVDIGKMKCLAKSK